MKPQFDVAITYWKSGFMAYGAWLGVMINLFRLRVTSGETAVT